MATTDSAAYGQIVDQFNLMRVATRDERFSRGDLAVLMSILQRYWPKYGNGWATLEILVDMSGMSRRQVIRALQNLEGASYIEVVSKGTRGAKGKPGRGSVFRPNFQLAQEYSDRRGTAKSGDTDVTSNVELGDAHVTTTTIFGDTHGTPTDLQLPADKAEELEGNRAGGPSSLSVGLAAAEAGGFEELWNKYGVRQNIVAARDAYTKLAPPPELHRDLVALAGAWKDADAAVGTPTAFRKHLHTWLGKQLYLEDLPSLRPRKTTPNKQPELVDGSEFDGEYVVMSTALMGKYAEVKLGKVGGGNTIEEFWNIDTADEWCDRSRLDLLSVAAGVALPADLEDLALRKLRGKPLRAEKAMLGWRYSPAATQH